MSEYAQRVIQAAVEMWGLEAQMLMVAEEGVELAHAVLKWRRAWKKYNKSGISLTRDVDDIDKLESKAVSRSLVKATAMVQKEAMQVMFMIGQLQVMQPGDYESIMEEVLQDCAGLLEARGVEL